MHTVSNYHPPADYDISLSKLPQGRQTTTRSTIFHLFQSLPREIQLMIFEEFISATKEPRIVLMSIEEVGLDSEYPDVRGWRFRVGNPGKLHASNPPVVARSLLQVSSASRHVATRFLDQPPETINPPCFTDALTGLGLSITSDIFWLLDDFPRLVNIYWDLPSVREGPCEEAKMHSVMISLHAFEEALHWREKNQKTGEYVNGPNVGRNSLLREFFFRFPVMKNLIVMVDAPRDHVALDQIQIIRPDDPTTYTISDEDRPARCHSAFEKYVALQSECIKLATSERELHEAMLMTMGSDFSNDDDELSRGPEYRWLQPWPELSFAFLKP